MLFNQAKIIALVILLFGICPLYSVAQEAGVLTWVQEHPEVALIEQKDLANFSTEDLNKLQGGFIVFNGQLTQQDIDNFVSIHPEVAPVNTDSQIDKQYVKDWINAHPEVKIVKRSEYNAAIVNDQEMYTKDKFVMVLIGERVRRLDVENYLTEKG